MRKVEHVLTSVYDKRGLEAFAKGLSELGIGILSSGGTARFLREKGIPVREVSEVTGSPELLGGRVKTLHPALHAAILARRDSPADIETLAEHRIPPIDLVVVNLYPFQEVTARPGTTLEEALENIDIGGHALLRAAVKNFRSVGVVVNPDKYEKVLSEIRETGGLIERTREELALEALAYASAYDFAIRTYLNEVLRPEKDSSPFPAVLQLTYRRSRDMRYGENPHQRSALYSETARGVSGVALAEQLHGGELSFNNLADLDAGWDLVWEFEEPTAAIIKHRSPCGVACGESLLEAYKKAYGCDPTSAYGGVIAVNRPLDGATAGEIASTFNEAVVAPRYEAGALEALKQKKNLRVLVLTPAGESERGTPLQFRQISGGMLVQERDTLLIRGEGLNFVTRKRPSEEELGDLLFAWKVAKHVRSNAMVLAKARQAVGVGAEQTSRVGALEIAVRKAGERSRGSVLASDAFIPFPDSVHLAASAGVTAIIQPGGSIRDKEVIDAADEHGIAMVFTGVRHFKH